MNLVRKSLTKPRPLWKNLLFSGCLFLLAAAAIELVSGMALWCFGNPFVASKLREERRIVLAADELPIVGVREVLHPYLGWVMNPKADWTNVRIPITPNDFGLVDDKSPIQKRAPNKLIVGICGGSVAMNLGLEQTATLENALQAAERFRGREIVFVRLGLGGYKQPQQLLELAYLLSLGAEFDLLINVDGFNEVGLYASENLRHHVHPSYPRAWRHRMQAEPSHRIVHLLYRYSSNKASRLHVARWFQSIPVQNCWTLNLVWKCLDTRYATVLERDLAVIMADHLVGDDYQVTGPPSAFKDNDDMYNSLATLWSNGSRQLHRLCEANGIEYHHFLQPNQYFGGSKPMGPEETKIAILDDFLPGKSIAVAYHLLVQEGERLATDGIRFHDLTMIFAQTTDPVYGDFCCHFNPDGNSRLARIIGDLIARDADKTANPSIQNPLSPAP